MVVQRQYSLICLTLMFMSSVGSRLGKTSYGQSLAVEQDSKVQQPWSIALEQARMQPLMAVIVLFLILGALWVVFRLFLSFVAYRQNRSSDKTERIADQNGGWFGDWLWRTPYSAGYVTCGLILVCILVASLYAIAKSYDNDPRIDFCREGENCKGMIAYSYDYTNTTDIFRYKGHMWPLASNAIVMEVPSAAVLNNGLVIGKDGTSYGFDHWYWKTLSSGEIADVTRQIASTPVSNVSYMSFVQWNQQYFQHIMFDTLPKLAFACEFLAKRKSVRVLVSSKLQGELMRATCPDLAGSRFDVIANLKSPLLASSVFIPQFRRNVDPVMPTTYLYMGLTQKKILHPLGTYPRRLDDRTKKRCLYLPRTSQHISSNKRVVLNEDVMLAHLRSDPLFEITIADLRDDWHLDRFAAERADIIFGPHGGALGNIVFARPGAVVVEFNALQNLLPDERHSARPCFLGLACSLGLPWFHVEPLQFSFDGPIKVDPSAVLEVLREAAEAVTY